MNKLEVITQELERNEDIVIVDSSKEIEKIRGVYVGQKIQYWVTSQNGLYSCQELKNFMGGLEFENIKPFVTRKFEQNVPTYIKFGWLYFNEKIGEVTTLQPEEIKIIKITHPDFINQDGLENGEAIIVNESNQQLHLEVYEKGAGVEISDINNGVTIHPIPNKEFYWHAKTGKFNSTSYNSSEYWSCQRDLNKYKRDGRSIPSHLLTRLVSNYFQSAH